LKPNLAIVNAAELVTLAARTSDLGAIEDGAVAVEAGRVVWVGSTKEFRRKTFSKPRKTVDATGKLVMPGFVDPHTHVVFAGARADELERKVKGESYVEILAQGGGISRTIAETRRAKATTIAAQSASRVRQLVRNGVTTIEAKSGYGGDAGGEAKLLRVIRRLSGSAGAELVPTLMGLHALPSDFGSASDYVDYVIRDMLPGLAALRPAFSDCFCEEGVFSRDECARYLRASEVLGMKLKIHADEFVDTGAASLAAEMRCVSADHLGKSSGDGIEMMAKEKVVAVLLPGTSFYSGTPYADAKKISASGCTVALGTDISPNSWIESPQVVMALACNGMKMTPADAVRGFTANAAAALGRDDIGRLVPGARADIVIHDLPSYSHLPYRIGGGYVVEVYKDGVRVYSADSGRGS
jgi:imidazolonepropionase